MIPAGTTTNNPADTLCFALFDIVKEGAAVIDIATKKFVYCNRSFLKLFGLESVTGSSALDFRVLRKTMLTEAEIAEREAIIQKKGFFAELVEYRLPDGLTFFGEAYIQCFNSNNADYYLFTINPVDKAFFELASMGILMVNKEGVIVTVNPFVIRQFGFEKAELIGKKIETLIPSRFHHQHIRQREGFVQNPFDRPLGMGMDLLAIKKDGTEFPVEVSLGCYPSDGDKYIIAFISDITFRKTTEAELLKLHKELESKVEHRTQALKEILRQLEASKAEQQKLNLFQKALFDSAGAMIIAIDEHGLIQTFNPEAERELGYSAAELTGIHTPMILHDPSGVKKRAAELSKELQREIPADVNVFFEKAKLGLQNEDEWIYVRKDGTRFPARLSIAPMKDEKGVIRGYVGVAFDISKTKKIEQELKETIQKEKDLSELKSRFVTMASHEFRTPLSTVLSSAYLIEKYAAAEDQGKRAVHLHRIVSSVNMLTDILNDFLSVGKIEEGKIQVRFSMFNISEEVKAVIESIENTLKTGQEVRYVHTGTEDVFLDLTLLKHIIINLASNASKFSPEKSLISISTACQDQQVSLTVSDRGIGIAKADQEHLMERFFRGANAVNIQGTGLGLHIVARYAELMNGVVECKSELEKGTAFTVTFNKKKS